MLYMWQQFSDSYPGLQEQNGKYKLQSTGSPQHTESWLNCVYKMHGDVRAVAMDIITNTESHMKYIFVHFYVDGMRML